MYNTNVKHAYQEKPWRRQLRRMGTYLAVLVVISVVAFVSLALTTQISTYGRYAQEAKVAIEDIQDDIRDLETQKAAATTSQSLKERSLDAGYHKVLSYEVIYLVVDGYAGKQDIDFSVAFDLDEDVKTLPRAFTISWIEWIEQTMRAWAYGGS